MEVNQNLIESVLEEYLGNFRFELEDLFRVGDLQTPHTFLNQNVFRTSI